jgi:hypothetical protein
MITEYVTFAQAQRIYFIVIYTWAVYNHADTCYNTVKKVYRLYNTTATLTNAAYRKFLLWRHTPKVTIKPVASTIGPSDAKEIELMEKRQQVEQISSKIPESLDDLVVEYFAS